MAPLRRRVEDSESGRAPEDLLASPMRRAIVDILANLPPDQSGSPAGLTAAEIAERLELHVTTARFHLDQLVEGQYLSTRSEAGRVGRPRKVYRFQPGSLDASSAEDAMKALAGLLTEFWNSGTERISAEEAGERWVASHVEPSGQQPARTPGAWLAKVGATVDLLAEWGYTPEIATSDRGRTAEITLVDCPFLALARDNPEVVCGIHRGLLRGAMTAAGEPDAAVSLRPFVAPRRCLATLTVAHEFDSGPSGPPSSTPASEEIA